SRRPSTQTSGISSSLLRHSISRTHGRRTFATRIDTAGVPLLRESACCPSPRRDFEGRRRQELPTPFHELGSAIGIESRYIGAGGTHAQSERLPPPRGTPG